MEPRVDFVSQIMAEQKLRGPDHQGCKVVVGADTIAVLGHNRLAIIDLSAAANQPFHRDRGRCWLTYNGEIYNYLELRQDLVSLGDRFNTQSDTEVLVAAWERFGPPGLERCNGMFAFAMYDVRAGELWLVRDRFGVKPLYYAIDGNQLVFASSPGAVARCLRRGPNLAYAARGGSVGIYDDETNISPYEGVEAVPAGCMLRCRTMDGVLNTELRRFYDLEVQVAGLRETLALASTKQLVSHMSSLLESAAMLRLRSDVPVGLSLSGGVDSSSVAAAAAAHGNLIGFSFGDPTEPLSEGPVVSEVAAAAGLLVRYVPSTKRRILADLFDATLAAQDAPFGGCSIIAQFAVCQRAKEDGVKVLLGGQGGDEAFMGYHKFKVFLARELASQGRVFDATRTAWGAVRSIGASGFGISALKQQVRRYSSDPRGRSALSVISQAMPPNLGYDPKTAVWRRQVRDVLSLSLPTLLRYEDRNSMGNSIETRLPFVDYRLVEFGIALPESVKVRDGYGKWILREAMRGRIPEHVRIARGKRGFDANHSYAIASGLGVVLRTRLQEVAGEIEKLTGMPLHVTERYSDRHLSSDASLITEAVTLVWLGQRLSGIGPNTNGGS